MTDAEVSNLVRLPAQRKLLEQHIAKIRSSGLNDETIELAQLHSETVGKTLAQYLGWRRYPVTKMGAALVFPCFDPEHASPYCCRLRPDRPRIGDKGKRIKYEAPVRGTIDWSFVPFLPPRGRSRGWLGDEERILYFTEGELKALALDQLGYAAVGGTGVDQFHDSNHRNETHELKLHPWILHYPIRGRRCRIVFDSDIVDKREVQDACGRLCGMLLDAGAAEVLLVRIPAEGDEKLGIDDYLAKHGPDATRALLEKAGEPVQRLSTHDTFVPVHRIRGLHEAPVDKKLRWPDGYSLDFNGLWDDGGDKPKKVTASAFFPGRILIDANSGHEFVEVHFQRDRAWRKVVIDRVDLGDRTRIIRELRPFGVMVDTDNAGDAVRFLSAFEAVNESRLPRTVMVNRCGWHTVAKGQATFCAPESVDGAPVVFRDREGTRAIVGGLGAAGDLEGHRQVVREAFDADPNAAAIILAAFAAPLLKPLGASSFGIHLVGDSSRGKSTMLRVAASLYGDPENAGWLPTWNSTSVGAESRAEVLCDLPFCIDEVGASNRSAEERDGDIYNLIEGTGRQRGTRDGGMREMKSWRTVVLSTGEKLLATDDTNAGARARILQMRVYRFGELGGGEVAALRSRVAEHYGHLGRAWLEKLVSIPEAEWEARRRELTRIAAEVRASAPNMATVQARRSGFIALLVTAEAMVSRLLGIGSPQGAAGLEVLRWLLEDEDGYVQSAAERALDLTRDLVASRPDAFDEICIEPGDESRFKRRTHHERIGFIDEDHILFVPQKLIRLFKDHNLDSAVVSDWFERGWLKTNDGRTRLRKKINGVGNFRYIALRKDALEGGAD